MEKQWEEVEVVAGSFQAEILRGFLEAQGIPVILSQEGAGHSVYALTVGKLGEVKILVPANQIGEARKAIQEYWDGVYEQASLYSQVDNGEVEDTGESE